MTAAFRVLIADDFDLWRRRVRSALQDQARWCVIGEACDGLDVVQKAHALEPDVIVLDVGMPTLNGVEAARRIRAHDPKVKILFLSEHRASDVVQAGLRAGGDGYVLKVDAGKDLLRALETIAGGGQFISKSLARESAHDETRASSQPARCHTAAFYSDDLLLFDEFAHSLEQGLAHGHACIAITTQRGLQRIGRVLEGRGLLIGRAIREGRYRLFDADEQAAAIMASGRLDVSRSREEWLSMLHDARRASISPSRGVVVCGSGTDTLWKAGYGDAAISLERLWNDIVRPLDVDTLCGFTRSRLANPMDERVTQALIAEHSAVHSR
jgi:DNA-binding NarL/FixJ family response regulator